MFADLFQVLTEEILAEKSASLRRCPIVQIFLGPLQLILAGQRRLVYTLIRAVIRLESLFLSEQVINLDGTVLDFRPSTPLCKNFLSFHLFKVGSRQLHLEKLRVLPSS